MKDCTLEPRSRSAAGWRNLLLVSLAAFGFVQAATAQSLTIAVSRTSLSLPLWVAEAKQFFAEEGVQVKLEECVGGQRCIRRLFDGEVALATASEMPVTLHSFNRTDFAIVATFVSSARDLKLIGRKSAGIGSVKDLAAKRIATVKGTSAHYFLDALLLFNDVDPRKVEVLAVAPEQIDSDQLGLAAVMAGAQEYLVKGTFDAALLRRSLSHAVQRKQVELALVERALHDELTGLPRRRLLVDRIGSAQRRCARESLQGALLFLDLDRFKQINDQYGHRTGDAVLCEAAKRLSATLRDSDTLARVGGDEFVVLLPAVGGRADAENVAAKLIEVLANMSSVDGCDIAFNASVGIAFFQGDHLDAEVLLHRADAAMYAAKQAGGGRSCVL